MTTDLASLPDLGITTHEAVLADLVAFTGKQVIDVGCGAGALVRWLRSIGAEPTGVECGEGMLRDARAADPDHVDAYLEGVGQDLPLDADCADVVVFSYSLQHVPRDAMLDAIRESHRVLRPGGLLVVVEPVAAGPSFEVTRLIDDETEVRGLAQEALVHVPDLGFDVITEQRYTVRTVLADADAMAARIVGVDPSRVERIERNRDEFRARFAANGTPADGGYSFDQESRIKIFRAR